MQPKIAIAATPGGSGNISALLYVEVHADVCGWSLESTTMCYDIAFFMLENFYAPAPAVLYRSVNDDVYGNWIRAEPPASHVIRCPLPENIVHAIEPLASKLMQDWLMFYDGADDSAVSVRTQQSDAARCTCAVRIRPSKISRLTRDTAGLHYATPGYDANVLDTLQKFRD